MLIWVAVALAALAAMGLALTWVKPRLVKDELRERMWSEFRTIADEIGSLAVVRTENGWPRLSGRIEDLVIDIDCENRVSYGLDGLLGLRCRIPDTEHAPSAALWIGDIDALRMQYGRPRPVGDGAGLFELYTRVEPSASDWWQEPALHDTLSALPGAGLLFHEGQLTVLFERLEADSVRTALRIPALVREGVRRVTLH